MRKIDDGEHAKSNQINEMSIIGSKLNRNMRINKNKKKRKENDKKNRTKNDMQSM